MIFFDYQFHLMILMQPSVGYLFKKKKKFFSRSYLSLLLVNILLHGLYIQFHVLSV